MKTAISIPDAVFRRVEDRAHALGMNRSEFYVRAAEEFLDRLDQDDLTQRFDGAIASAGGAQAEQREWSARAGAQLVSGDDW